MLAGLVARPGNALVAGMNGHPPLRIDKQHRRGSGYYLYDGDSE